MKKFVIVKLKQLLSIVIIGILAILLFQTFLIYSSGLKKFKVANMGKYYQKLDGDAQRHITNNVFSVITTTPNDDYSTSYSFGTCWSFYSDEDAWYLMTNYHVISRIVEKSSQIYSSEDGESAFLKRTKLLYGHDYYPQPFVQGSVRLVSVGFDSRTLTIEAQKAVIIYDRFCEAEYPDGRYQDPNEEQLFANIDERTQKRYQLDMALIRLTYRDISISETNNNEKLKQ